MDLYSIKMLEAFGDAKAFRRLFERLHGQWLVNCSLYDEACASSHRHVSLALTRQVLVDCFMVSGYRQISL